MEIQLKRASRFGTTQGVWKVSVGSMELFLTQFGLYEWCERIGDWRFLADFTHPSEEEANQFLLDTGLKGAFFPTRRAALEALSDAITEVTSDE